MTPTSDPTRLRQLTLRTEHLVEVLRGERAAVGVPADAQLVAGTQAFKFAGDECLFHLWSAGFAPVPEGEPVPPL